MFGEEEFLYKRTDLLSIEMVFVNNGITKTAFASAREMVVTTNTSNVTCYLLTWKRLKKVVFMKHLYRNALFMKVLPPLKTIDGLRGLKIVIDFSESSNWISHRRFIVCGSKILRQCE